MVHVVASPEGRAWVSGPRRGSARCRCSTSGTSPASPWTAWSACSGRCAAAPRRPRPGRSGWRAARRAWWSASTRRSPGLHELALRADRGRGPQHPAHRRLRADEGAGDAGVGDHRRGGGDGEALRRGRLARVRERRARRHPRRAVRGAKRATTTLRPDASGRGLAAESAQRLEKARALRALGVDPYPTRYERTHGLAEIKAAHDGKSLEELDRGERPGEDRRPGDDAARARQGLVRDPLRRRGRAAGLHPQRRRRRRATACSTSSTAATSSGWPAA